MPLPPGFDCSLGDVVTGIKTISQAVQALRATSAVPAECRDTIAFLGPVQHTLTKVLEVKPSLVDEDGFQQIWECAQLCCEEVVRFLEKMKGDSVVLLAPQTEKHGNGIRYRMKRGATKFKWSFQTKHELAALRTSLKFRTSRS
jgi:hypothetical protein